MALTPGKLNTNYSFEPILRTSDSCDIVYEFAMFNIWEPSVKADNKFMN